MAMAASDNFLLAGVPDDMMSEASASEFFAIDYHDQDDDEFEEQDAPSQTHTAPSNTVPTPPPSLVPSTSTKKDKSAKPTSSRTAKLNLLDLPVDILRLIVQEITRTNDLNALALTNSTLHNLAVPHIYSRFDIVWPDVPGQSSDSKVDALTYGLSTICFGGAFAKCVRRLQRKDPSTCKAVDRLRRVDYASYTRKFSLGNGPADWVADYLINKESGKLLGTLAAIAIEKMVNLETFVWDMPTGVLSDIFLALGSLQDRPPNTGDCKLDKVWVRWHDNSEPLGTPSSASPSMIPPPPAVIPTGSILSPIGILLPSGTSHPPPVPTYLYEQSRVEYPTFSALSPLRSLSVLEIDELAYLDEMSMLIERSHHRLQELRVGIAKKAVHQNFAQPWDGLELQQVDMKAKWPGESTIGDRRLGGVLGILVGRIYDIRRRPARLSTKKSNNNPDSGEPSDTAAGVNDGETMDAATTPTIQQNGHSSVNTKNTNGQSTDTTKGESSTQTSAESSGTGTGTANSSKARGKTSAGNGDDETTSTSKRLDGKLRLHTLELERVSLSLQVCTKAIDWTTLTTLTLLNCQYHEALWKVLRKQYMPTATVPGIRPSIQKSLPSSLLQYPLSLKNIHTDVSSPALVAFLKDALAPNSLEVLFLQDRRRAGPPGVTIEQIFKGPVRRHRASLRKLLLDSSDKPHRPNGTTESIRWRVWMLSAEMIMYLTNGKMTNLRELAVSISFKDWHSFLQRLPNIPQLRALYLPNIDDRREQTITALDPKELALQIIDIVTLRPEIQLCYAGIQAKCFEILETKSRDRNAGRNANGTNTTTIANGNLSISLGGHSAAAVAAGIDSSSDVDDDDDDSHVDPGETTDEDSDEETPTSVVDMDETQSEGSAADGQGDALDSDSDSLVDAEMGGPVCHFRLRDILFFDEKVSIFKARHGHL